ncbi:metal transporter family GufA protein [Haloferax sp. BAB-2207]|nr:metal transporter family GufA protein [Haloferax sp. BAB-2207]
MDQVAALTFVFLAGLVTAIATGVGAIPFFFVSDVSDRWNVALWGVASGIMVSASLFGLVFEGLANGTPLQLGIGMLAGVALVLVAHHVIEGAEVNPKQYEEADFRKLLLILGILTVHSFPEGVAVGVSFADLGLDGGFQLFGFVVPLLAVFMTIAISIHNIPEGWLSPSRFGRWTSRTGSSSGGPSSPVCPSPSARSSRSTSSASPGSSSRSASASRRARWCFSSSRSSSPRRSNSESASRAAAGSNCSPASSPASPSWSRWRSSERGGPATTAQTRGSRF